MFHDLLTLKFVPCHRRPDRSIFIKGKQFPVCARCMAILLGYLFVIPLMIFSIHIPLYIGILLNIPMVLDGYTQLKKWRTSNNTLRIITGLGSGLGMSIIIDSISTLLINTILNL